MLTVSLETAERMVEAHDSLSWDGWTIVHIKPNAAGWLKSNGVRYNGKWYVQTRYPVDNNGKYTVPKAFGNGL